MILKNNFFERLWVGRKRAKNERNKKNPNAPISTKLKPLSDK